MMTVYLSFPLPNYLDALKLTGVQVAASYETADALLLPGGGDIHPKYYGQSLCGAETPDIARDLREFFLVRQFVLSQRPILGICRGMQILNTAFGGTLHQHISGHSRLGATDRLHRVRNFGILRSLYGTDCTVNSAHHQSVDLVGAGLRVIQRAEDGVIEAFCHTSLPILGVQWHPERLCGAFTCGDSADGLLLLKEFFSYG